MPIDLPSIALRVATRRMHREMVNASPSGADVDLYDLLAETTRLTVAEREAGLEIVRLTAMHNVMVAALRDIAALPVSSDNVDELRERLLRAIGIALVGLKDIGSSPTLESK